ncbi:MAG: phage holin family protein [Parasutterella excrementihominis]
MSDRNNADPGLFTILNQVVDGLATRLQIVLSSSPSPKQRGKNSRLHCPCRPFRPLCARFYIGRTSVIFWEDHRVFVSCCIAGAYLLLFLFFLGKARNLAANMPYAFEESRQILAADVAAFRASCNKKAGVATQQPVDPTKEENNNAGK